MVSSLPSGDSVQLVPPPTTAPILVHISGAVTNPGVYTLPVGSRVRDAVQAAGGAIPGANFDSLNLAAVLQDGETLAVPLLSVPGLEPQNLDLPGQDQSPTQSPIFPININTATAEELVSLPGIGPSIAQQIIKYRQENGPFQVLEAIQDVPGIGPGIFEKIQEQITLGK
jgi:competence protein ComEA